MDFFQLFMFDFDGLLVDTESGHFEAYRRMCANRGFNLDWDFNEYTKHAHYSHDAIEKGIYRKFPELYIQEPNWKVLYKEKTKIITDLYHEGAIKLMPGADRILTALEDKDLPRCVVTHSSKEIVNVLRKQYPVLNTVPDWITREDYVHPKPDPECYITAMKKFLPEGGKAIGFEDAIRGLRALIGSGAKGVLVTSMDYPEIPKFVDQGVIHVKSLDEIFLPQLV